VTAFWIVDYLCLALLLCAGVLVVLLRNLNSSVMALSGLGTVLTLLFVVLHAPDVAHAEAVVGAIVLPTLYLIAIAKVRAQLEQRRALGEEGADDD
jgi:uncharacterized MnhB-related membrane protein